MGIGYGRRVTMDLDPKEVEQQIRNYFDNITTEGLNHDALGNF